MVLNFQENLVQKRISSLFGLEYSSPEGEIVQPILGPLIEEELPPPLPEPDYPAPQIIVNPEAPYVAQASIKPVVPDSWTGPYFYVKEPSIYFPVWIDPAYDAVNGAEGVSLGKRLREMLVNVGTIASVGFYEGPPPQECRWRFHHRDQTTLCNLSRQWRQYPSGACSSYFAVNPNGRDIYTGSRTKPSQGSKPLSYINAIRVPGHAWMYAMGWPEQGFPSDGFMFGQNVTRSCMRSPYMSAEIWWTTLHYLQTGEKAGNDSREIQWWQMVGRKYGGNGTCCWWRESA